jgi:hypothetical protein
MAVVYVEPRPKARTEREPIDHYVIEEVETRSSRRSRHRRKRSVGQRAEVTLFTSLTFGI